MRGAILLLLLLGVLSGHGSAAESGPGGAGESARQPRLRAGASQAEITPPIGAPLLGALVASTGVHDPLFARALVIGDGAERAAIVCLDLVGMDLALAREIRARVQQRTGIALTLLNCSHTHSAPFTIPWSVQGWQSACNELRSWRGRLIETITDAVARADAAAAPAVLRVGRAPAQVGWNRRLFGPKGVVMKPNREGASVPWVDVLRVDGRDGKPTAILLSHAAHPVIVHGASTLISADYPGCAVATVRKRFGAGTVVMFAQGCGGNVNGEPLQGGFAAAERAGEALGEAAIKAAIESKPLAAAPLRTKSVSFALPLQDYPAPEACRRALEEAEARLAQAKAKGADERSCWYPVDQVLCLRDLFERSKAGRRGELPFDLAVLTVGKEFCLLTMSHEVFAEYALWIDQNSPFRHAMVLGYTNGCESYVPTDNDFDLGGYEAVAFPESGAALRYARRVPLRPGVERQIKQQIRALWETGEK